MAENDISRKARKTKNAYGHKHNKELCDAYDVGRVQWINVMI